VEKPRTPREPEVPVKPEPAPRDEELRALVEAEQVRLSIHQLHRIPLPHLLLDFCLAWTASTAGVGEVAWIWFAVMTVCQVGRSAYLIRLHRGGGLTSAQMLQRMALLLTLLGALHAVQVVLVFLQPAGTARYVLTMILVGNAAGAVSPAAGHLRSYVWWAAVYGGTLVLCWLLQGTGEGAAIAALILFLFGVLTMYVRDAGATLTKMVALSESLRMERDRAQRASEAKTRFFAAASHDLRQPLTALSFHAATVQAVAALGGNDTLGSVGRGIRRALEDSRALLDSLLEVSQLDAGVIRANPGRVAVDALLASVRETFEPQAQQRGLVLQCASGARGQAAQAWTDPLLLQRIVQNLVANAIKFTEKGGVHLSVAPAPGGGMVIRVRDTGPGIPLEAQETVFEEFFQLGNAERNRAQGLGLGLAIVRRLADLIGAQVRLHSRPGQGSVFEVWVPAADPGEAADAAGAAGAPLATAVTPEWRSAGRVLIVDDERQVREALSGLLVTLGWEVTAVPDQEGALAAWKEGFAPHAIVVDFRLGEGATGLDALEALRRAGCAAPAWMVTGDTAPERIAAAHAAGIPVIYKPVDGMKLAGLLRTALGTTQLPPAPQPA
jgi:two-component system, sensor histidine kinase